MTCPHCGIRLKVKSADIGTTRACPKCSKAIKIGGDQPSSADQKPKPADESSQRPQDEFPMVCDCGTRFYASPSQIGKTIDCPDCLTEHKVSAPNPDSSRKRLGPSSDSRPPSHPSQAVKPTNLPSPGSPSPPPDDDDEYKLQPIDDAPAWNPAHAPKPEADRFHIRCSVCSSTLAVNKAMIGKKVKCPDCHSSTTVQKPTFVTKKTVVVAKDPKIGVEEAHKNKKNKEISDRLMNDAHQHQEELERSKPVMATTAPFSEGIYNYPFLPRVFQGWILLVPLLAIATNQIIGGIALSESGSMSAIGAVFMFAIGGFLYCLFALTAGHVLMTLLQTTAIGYHQPEEWERFEAAGWFGRAFYLVCALIYSILPFVFITTFVAGFIPVPLRVIGIGTIAFFAFPFVLMSMMDADSPVVPWSGYVWKTIGKSPGSWFKFFMGTAFVMALSTIPIVASVHFLGGWGMWLASAFAMIALTIYFRLLGRLAWVLDQLPVDPEEKDEEATDEDLD